MEMIGDIQLLAKINQDGKSTDSCDVYIDEDGDGQMDSTFIPNLIAPISKGLCDYIKGSRFHNRENLAQMPYVRLLGNIGLSFLTKVASGYWDIFDSTSGFTAIHREALKQIDIDSLDNGYFFETNMLIQLYHIHAVVHDVPIMTTYGEEKSEVRPLRVALSFSPRLVGAFIKRIICLKVNIMFLVMVLNIPCQIKKYW